MAVRWYGSTAYGSAVVRQYGRTCIANGIWRYSCTAVSVKCTEHYIRRTATRHTAHDERQYGVRWRTGGVGELGVRRTAHGVRHGVQCTARSPGSRDQTLASRGSGPLDQSQVVRNKQTNSSGLSSALGPVPSGAEARDALDGRPNRILRRAASGVLLLILTWSSRSGWIWRGFPSET